MFLGIPNLYEMLKDIVSYLVPSWKDKRRPLPPPPQEEDYGVPVSPV
tara:strand:+ start:1003 stop:1143 length:141 start_codon:yes stop_codon:yes gene_type:complete